MNSEVFTRWRAQGAPYGKTQGWWPPRPLNAFVIDPRFETLVIEHAHLETIWISINDETFRSVLTAYRDLDRRHLNSYRTIWLRDNWPLSGLHRTTMNGLDLPSPLMMRRSSIRHDVTENNAEPHLRNGHVKPACHVSSEHHRPGQP